MNFNEFYKKALDENPNLKKVAEDKDRKFYYDVAHLITEARFHAGFTQEKLAKKLKTKQSSIARIESGKNLPSLLFLFKIAKALNTYLIAPRFGFMTNNAVATIHISHVFDGKPNSILASHISTNSNQASWHTNVQ